MSDTSGVTMPEDNTVNETFELLRDFNSSRKVSIGSRKTKTPRSPVDRLAVSVAQDLVSRSNSRCSSTVSLVDIAELSMHRPRPISGKGGESLTALFLTNPSTPVATDDREAITTPESSPRTSAIQKFDRRAQCMTPPLSPHTDIAKQLNSLRRPPPSFKRSDSSYTASGKPAFTLPPPVQRRSCSDGPRMVNPFPHHHNSMSSNGNKTTDTKTSTGTSIMDLLDLCAGLSTNNSSACTTKSPGLSPALSRTSSGSNWLTGLSGSPTISRAVSPCLLDLTMSLLHAGL